MKNKYIVNLDEVLLSDLELVGGKNASLGEMIQNLGKLGINIPGGFALTVEAYWEFIRFNKLDKTIRSLIKRMDPRRKSPRRHALGRPTTKTGRNSRTRASPRTADSGRTGRQP